MDTIVSLFINNSLDMTLLTLLTTNDIQEQLADTIKRKRKEQNLSRQALAERSTVPASTIKKFETSSQISLRQFILLWQSLDSLDKLAALSKEEEKVPTSIEEVLKG